MGMQLTGILQTSLPPCPNQDLWLLWFRDSEDNLLGVMEERKK